MKNLIYFNMYVKLEIRIRLVFLLDLGLVLFK
jgi:hypothetical protein